MLSWYDELNLCVNKLVVLESLFICENENWEDIWMNNKINKVLDLEKFI